MDFQTYFRQRLILELDQIQNVQRPPISKVLGLPPFGQPAHRWEN